MCLYFTFINSNKVNKEFKKQDEFKTVEILIEQYCEDNGL